MRIGEAKNDHDLVIALENVRNRRMELRRAHETVWWNNISLILGDHYASWSPSLGTFEDKDWQLNSSTDKKPRMVINHALTVGRTELSKLTKARPIMEIIANSDETEDIAAAKVGRAALDFAEWKFRLRKKRKQALWWMIQTGLGALGVGWDYLDDGAGFYEFVIDPETGEAVFNKARERQLRDMLEGAEISDLKTEKYPLGDLEYTVFSPFQILPDETCLEFADCWDVITTEVVNIDWLKGVHPKGARDLKPESDSTLGVIEQRLMRRMGIVAGAGSMSESVAEGVKVHTWWLKPGYYKGNKFLEKGKCLQWAQGSKVIYSTEGFPYQDGRLPFVFFQHIPTSTSIWPDCIMSHIRGPNLEIDKTVSQLIDNKDYMANPMWRIATQHKIKGEIKNVAGSIVRYRHVPNVPPPEPIQGLQMPTQVENLLAGLREQILDISGQSEVARGRVPTGVRSGVAVAYLQEEDDTKIAPTIENMEEEIALMGSMTLERFGQFYTTERIIRFYRRDGAFDVRRFKGADLKNNTDVICQAGSAMPRSKAARQQYVLELISLGILKDPKKIQDMLEIGEGEPDDQEKATAQANRENNMMQFGLPDAMWRRDNAAVPEEDLKKVSVAIPVKSWHNHQLHIMRHTSVMMDPDFEQMQISHPEIVRLFDEHITMHQQELQKQQQQQMQMLAAMKGAPGGTPAGNGAQPPGDQMGTSFMQQSTIPEVVGGGAGGDITARTIR